jgi:hypothetical protein
VRLGTWSSQHYLFFCTGQLPRSILYLWSQVPAGTDFGAWSQTASSRRMSGPPAFLSEDSMNESFPGSGPETLSCPHSKSIEGGTDLATGRFHASISGTMMAFNVTRAGGYSSPCISLAIGPPEAAHMFEGYMGRRRQNHESPCLQRTSRRQREKGS